VGRARIATRHGKQRRDQREHGGGVSSQHGFLFLFVFVRPAPTREQTDVFTIIQRQCQRAHDAVANKKRTPDGTLNRPLSSRTSVSAAKAASSNESCDSYSSSSPSAKAADRSAACSRLPLTPCAPTSRLCCRTSVSAATSSDDARSTKASAKASDTSRSPALPPAAVTAA